MRFIRFSGHETIKELQNIISGADKLASLGKVDGTSTIKSKLYKVRRIVKGKNPDPEKAVRLLKEGLKLYTADVDWRQQAAAKIGPALSVYETAIRESIGLRLQRRLESSDQIKSVASCLAIHRDYSLQF